MPLERARELVGVFQKHNLITVIQPVVGGESKFEFRVTHRQHGVDDISVDIKVQKVQPVNDELHCMPIRLGRCAA